MSSYRIKFINDLVNSAGHNFHCCQDAIDIRVAKSKERAIQAAKHRFARRQAVSHWTARAHTLEVEEIAPVSQSRTIPTILGI